MSTLSELMNQVKRRVRILVAENDGATEVEKGTIHSDNAIKDAINAARNILPTFFQHAEIWASQKQYFITSADEPDYTLDSEVFQIDSVYWDVSSSGKVTSSSVLADRIYTAEQEEAIIVDPMNEPSTSNPKYRLVDGSIRLIVSTDRTVPTGKYVLVEFLGTLSTLTNLTDNSGVSNAMDEITVEYAVYYLQSDVHPNVATLAMQNVMNLVARANESYSRRRK